MIILGLTGGIATGKSTVSHLFRGKGVVVVDCDEIAHQITKKNHAGYKRVVKAFGPSILKADKEIDRDMLGKLVFESSSARKKLNRATHPAVTWELAKQLSLCFVKCKRLVVMDMPLLFETGAYILTWPRVLVTANPGTQKALNIKQVQIERLMKRDGCTRELAEAKISSQMPQESKQRKSQHVVDNSGSHSSTAAQVDAIIGKMQKGLWWKGFISAPATVVTISAFAVNSLVSQIQ